MSAERTAKAGAHALGANITEFAAGSAYRLRDMAAQEGRKSAAYGTEKLPDPAALVVGPELNGKTYPAEHTVDSLKYIVFFSFAVLFDFLE